MVQAAAPTVADDAALAAFGMPQDVAQAAVQVVEQALMVVEPSRASAQVWFAQAWRRGSDPNEDGLDGLDGLDAPDADVEHEQAQRACRAQHAVLDSGMPGR